MDNKNQVIKANLNFELVKKESLMVGGEFSTYNDKMVMKISRKCGGNALSVYMCLYSHLNKNSGICNPAINTIATETGIGEKTVRRMLNSLKEEGFIDWAQIKTSTNAFNNNHYAFLYGTTLTKQQVETEIEVDTKREVIKPDLSKFKNKEIKIPKRKVEKKEVKVDKVEKKENDLKSIAVKAAKIAKSENEKIDTTPIFNALKSENKNMLANAIDAVLWMAFEQDSEKVENIFDKQTCSFK